ncbi:MAG: hypothetical protein M3N53_03540 [Actinomycetota bacterium]|nr:hypothetical protein [Actinomycetota bacterium]
MTVEKLDHPAALDDVFMADSLCLLPNCQIMSGWPAPARNNFVLEAPFESRNNPQQLLMMRVLRNWMSSAS